MCFIFFSPFRVCVCAVLLCVCPAVLRLPMISHTQYYKRVGGGSCFFFNGWCSSGWDVLRLCLLTVYAWQTVERVQSAIQPCVPRTDEKTAARNQRTKFIYSISVGRRCAASSRVLNERRQALIIVRRKAAPFLFYFIHYPQQASSAVL